MSTAQMERGEMMPLISSKQRGVSIKDDFEEFKYDLDYSREQFLKDLDTAVTLAEEENSDYVEKLRAQAQAIKVFFELFDTFRDRLKTVRIGSGIGTLSIGALQSFPGEFVSEIEKSLKSVPDADIKTQLVEELGKYSYGLFDFRKDEATMAEARKITDDEGRYHMAKSMHELHWSNRQVQTEWDDATLWTVAGENVWRFLKLKSKRLEELEARAGRSVSPGGMSRIMTKLLSCLPTVTGNDSD